MKNVPRGILMTYLVLIIVEVLMISKPGKPLNQVSSYRPISLLPVISKLSEKLLLAQLKPLIIKEQLIPTHQFGFWHQHLTTEQVHRITEITELNIHWKKEKYAQLCSWTWPKPLIRFGMENWSIRWKHQCLDNIVKF